ncbi:hypothetical protein VTN77DRAFT_6535 [Rasamsonia byssochlamydoides]|uniref:uncharacterized protein n=1 Tax=Rasamsonia byssochlamydoides TaxID=89139 RepID=UPI0037437500
MLSGTGPAAQLEKRRITVIQHLPAVGQGLRDHGLVPLVFLRKDNATDRGAFYGSQEAMDTAMDQWKKSHTGPWTTFACQLGIGYFKSDKITASDEFKMLPADEQEFLLQDTVPHHEFLTHFPYHMLVRHWPQEHMNYSCLLVFLLNGQSRGEVTLQLSNPDDPLLFDPKMLSHPFDCRVAVEATRHLLQVVKHPAFIKDNVAELIGPRSESEEDLLEFWRENICSSFHMTGTVKIGKVDDVDAGVDSKFRVLRIDCLRVADMSVVPLLPNNHPQATAYVTGVSCAETLIEEYNLA